MRLRSVFCAFLLLILTSWGLLFAQKEFREYPGEERVPLPPDWRVTHEWVTARMMWHTYGGRGAFGFTGWGTDYPGGDRNLIEGVRRLTLIDVRSVEQPVEFDGSDDPYNWPFMYAVEVGRWAIDDVEGAQLREYFDRGGFLMVDDFHGRGQWAQFEEGLSVIFPDREWEELPPNEPMFHMLSDVDLNVQIAGEAALQFGRTWEQQDDTRPRWRGIRDAKGRIIVAICHNMDLGDAWEHSNDAWYPEEMASAAHRVLVNYATYDLTH